MRLKKVISLCVVIYTVLSNVNAACPNDVLTIFSFVLDYAMWRGWHQVVIKTFDLDPVCSWATLRFIKCMEVHGIAASMGNEISQGLVSHLGVILLLPRLKENSTEDIKENFKKFHDSRKDAAYFDWLITARSYKDFDHFNRLLNDTAILFNENIIIAYPKFKEINSQTLYACNRNFIYKNKGITAKDRRKTAKNFKRTDDYQLNTDNHQNKTKLEIGHDNSERFNNLKENKTYRNESVQISSRAPGYSKDNYSGRFIMVNVSQTKGNILNWIPLNFQQRNAQYMYLFQYIKVRINSTLYGNFLGVWNKQLLMSNVASPYTVEARKFMGDKLIFGRCNTTLDGTSPSEDFQLSTTLLDDVLYFLTTHLNASYSTHYYDKLGYKTYEGSWTGLLGALKDRNIDLALELVASHASHHDDMDLIFPIAETMFNIYIRDKETSAVRDIFLAPFSVRLLVCVFAVMLVFALAIFLISKFTAVSRESSISFANAFLWSAGILCQQGGFRTPTNPSSSILLIVSLLFALVTYNSYAAFITSVLSVRVASVDTVSAVLQSPNLKIGYIKDGPDQMYLMSTKDVQLNAFYIRGYSEAENLVMTAEEGLLRAAKNDYAFFSEQRTARTTLRSLSQERGRCALRELTVPSTNSHLAFPLLRGSPYARPILISLLQLREAGILARLEKRLVPEMPKCTPLPHFTSAKATDVRSAFVVYLLGLFLAAVIGIGEFLWKNRYHLLEYVTRSSRYMQNMQNTFN